MKTSVCRPLLAAVLVLGGVLSHAGATPTPSAPKPVVVGVEDDCAPFAWVGQDGQPQGYSVDVVRLAFSEMKVPLKLVVLPFERCMREARLGKVAACFNSMFNEDTAKEFHLHQAPLFHEPLGVLALASAPREVVDQQAMQGRTVGYVQAYQYPDWFIKSTTITRVPARNDKALLLMLARGRVDFALYGPTMAAWYLQTAPELRGVKLRLVGEVSNDGFGVAFSRRHPQGEALRHGFDQALVKLQARGVFTALRSKHLSALEP